MAGDPADSSASPWPLLAAFYFTALNLFGIWFLAPLLLEPNILLSPFFFGSVMLFWRRFIERRGTSTWVRGGLVALCSSVSYYFIAGLVLGALSWGVGTVVMWFAAVGVVPFFVLAGVVAAVFRRRMGGSDVVE
jgi:hypothetical protein